MFKVLPISDQTMNEKTTTSNRVAKRYQTQEPARLEVLSKKEFIYCRMRNLSSTGAFFEITNSSYSPKKGDIVRITINLKQVNASHIINGEVIWSKGYGVGVSFIKQK